MQIASDKSEKYFMRTGYIPKLSVLYVVEQIIYTFAYLYNIKNS